MTTTTAAGTRTRSTLWFPLTAAAAATPVRVVEADDTGPWWECPIAIEGEAGRTGDSRFFEHGALTWATLPIPFRHTPADYGSHDGAILVGSVARIERREGGVIWGTGPFDDSPAGAEAARQVRAGHGLGVSVDLDNVSAELRVSRDVLERLSGDADPAAGLGTDEQGRVIVDRITPDDEVQVTTSARIRALTMVMVQAFEQTRISLADTGRVPVTDSVAPVGVAASGATGTTETDTSGAARGSGTEGETMTVDAAARITPEHGPEVVTLADPLDALTAGAVPVEPPAGWFDQPELDGPVGLTVTLDGRVYGHLATWDTCHISYGECVPPPRSPSGYAYFHTGAVRCADGSTVPTGRITLGTGHADLNAGAAHAAAHYDDTGTVVADVRAGEDQYGIWVAGALRPGVTPERVRELRAAPLSGDWRPIGGSRELVAALAVNTAGFPIPRVREVALAASGAPGTPGALVAAGMVEPAAVTDCGCGTSPHPVLSPDTVRALDRFAADERVKRGGVLRDRVQAAGRVRQAGELASRVARAGRA